TCHAAWVLDDRLGEASFIMQFPGSSDHSPKMVTNVLSHWRIYLRHQATSYRVIRVCRGDQNGPVEGDCGRVGSPPATDLGLRRRVLTSSYPDLSWLGGRRDLRFSCLHLRWPEH